MRRSEEKAGEDGYLQLSGRLSAGRYRGGYHTCEDGQPEHTGICPDAPCEKATGKASAFGTQQGQVLQDGKKGFPEHAFVGSVATVHIVSCGLSVLRGLPGQGLAEKGDDYGCGTGRAD